MPPPSPGPAAPHRRRALPVFLFAFAGACVLAGTLAVSPPRADAVPQPGTPNQPWPTSCDVDVGLVIDRSNSIRRDHPGNPQLIRSAAGGMVDRLTGTGARVAVWSFGTMASGFSGPNPWHAGVSIPASAYPSIGFTALPDDAAGDQVRDVIDAIPFVAGAASDPNDPDVHHAGSTNWEAALGRSSAAGPGAVAPDGSRPGDADVVILLTDGNPTVHGADPPPTGGGVPATSDGDVNAGVAASIDAKGGGTRVVAVGATLGQGLTVANLQRVTGGYPDARQGDDYYLTDLEGLDQTLFEISTRFCGGTLVVRKLVPGAEPGSWRPEPGWPITTTFPQGPPRFVQPAAGTRSTGPDGAIEHRWISSAGGTPVRISETLGEGQALHHAHCATAGQPAQPQTSTTIDVVVPQNGLMLCELYNYRPAAALAVDKVASPTSVPAGGGEVTYTVTVSNPSSLDRVRITGLDDDRFGDLAEPDPERLVASTCDELIDRVLEPATSAECTFRAHVDTAGGDHVNVVTATAVAVQPTGQAGGELQAEDDAVVTGQPAPDLAVVKDDGHTEVRPGQELTYTIEATNHGNADADGAVLTDTLPPGTTFVAASDGGTHDGAEDGGVVTWPAFDLAVDDTATRTVTVQVSPEARAGDRLRNVVVVENEDDPDLDDNTAEDIDEVVVTQRRVERPGDDPPPDGSSGGTLPRTGSDPKGWALIGLGLVSAGTSVVLVTRLRRERQLPADT